MGALRRGRRERSDAGVPAGLSAVLVRVTSGDSAGSANMVTISVVVVVDVVMTMESAVSDGSSTAIGSRTSSTMPIDRAMSFLGVSEVRLASSPMVVGGVELRDATLENVSLGAPKLASEETSRGGDIVASDCILMTRRRIFDLILFHSLILAALVASMDVVIVDKDALALVLVLFLRGTSELCRTRAKRRLYWSWVVRVVWIWVWVLAG
jgi:hypothetical protein